MDRFEYNILVGENNPNAVDGVIWHLSSNWNQPLEPLPIALNRLGQQGWEVVAIGDVVFGSRSEIILKRRIS